MRTRRRGLLPALAALPAALVLAAAGGAGTADEERQSAAGSWQGLLGEQPVRTALGHRFVVVLKIPSLADRVTAAGGRASDVDQRRWTREARREQNRFLARMNARQARIERQRTYVLVLNGFSAELDPGTVALLERATEVDGVYPVRAAFPAAAARHPLEGPAFAPGGGRRVERPFAAYDGRGVTVALLDTGVDRGHPYVSGRVQDGIDVVRDRPGAPPAANPDDVAQIERHGTELAGVIVGAAGPGRISGVAPGASVLPIRVGGWQRDISGRWSVYSSTELLLAGLEHAVDPDDDGSAHDAARVALVGLVEPFSGFAEGPLARGIRGATRLDTLVVSPAGNDGPFGPAFGSIAGPGGASEALTVGAADTRAEHPQARVVVRAGLRVLYDSVVPLAGAVLADAPVTLRPGTPEPADTSALERFFDERGYSRVAGRVALVAGGAAGTRAAVESAARAGAAAVLVYGVALPPGGLGLDERVPVPVVSVPDAVGAALLDQQQSGADVAVTVAPAASRTGQTARRVAPFSSRGLAFDGGVKPELVAPGIEVPTSQPRTGRQTPRYATVSGSSISAAVVAGHAAVLAQARPELNASALKAALVGTAAQLRATPLTSQGTGLLDTQRAARVEVVAAPSALAFPRATRRDWRRTRTITVRNVSTRRLRVAVRLRRHGFPAAETRLDVRPKRLDLGPGEVQPVEVSAHVPLPTAGGPLAEGVVVLRPQTGVATRVPFAIAFARRQLPLIPDAGIVPDEFEPSHTTPAVLSIQAGRVRVRGHDRDVQPISRLEIELWTETGRRMGTLATLRNLLPGVYTFGITGRDPGGGTLGAGRYVLRLVATPTGGGPRFTRSVQFAVK